MNKVKLNETPVRTSRNFNINNIKLENIEIPEIIPDFENVTIIGDTSKINIEQNTSNIELVYGLNEFFTNQVKMQSNQKLKLTIDDKENSETQIEFKFDDENLIKFFFIFICFYCYLWQIYTYYSLTKFSLKFIFFFTYFV